MSINVYYTNYLIVTYFKISDYFLFLNQKKSLAGRRFASTEEVTAETNTYFVELDKSYYIVHIKKLEKRWIKCIDLKEK